MDDTSFDFTQKNEPMSREIKVVSYILNNPRDRNFCFSNSPPTFSSSSLNG